MFVNIKLDHGWEIDGKKKVMAWFSMLTNAKSSLPEIAESEV